MNQSRYKGYFGLYLNQNCLNSQYNGSQCNFHPCIKTFQHFLTELKP